MSLILGESDQPIMHRLFFPEPKCNRASAHLVNAFGILGSKNLNFILTNLTIEHTSIFYYFFNISFRYYFSLHNFIPS